MYSHTRKLHGQTSYLCPKCDNYVVISLKEHFKNCLGKLNINRTLESQKAASFNKEKGKIVQNKKTKITKSTSLTPKPGELNPFYIRKRAKITFSLEDIEESEEVDDPEWEPMQ